MTEDRFSVLLYRVSFSGCFLGGAATVYFLSGVSGYIGSRLLNITTAAAVLFVALFFFYIFFARLLDRSPLGLALWLLISLVLGTEIVLGLVPPTARDELSHHLAIPRLYANAGRIFEVPFAPYSYYPMLLDMLYTPWVRWGWDSIPKLIHGLFGFLTGLLLYAYLARRLSPIYGLLGFLFFISTPAVLRLGNWAYVDLGVAFYSATSLLCLLRWVEDVRDKRWLILAGLSAGFALATKPNGLVSFLLLFFLLLLLKESLGRKDRIQTAGQALLFLIIAFIPVGAWLMKNLIWTGNPFFPLLSGFFGSRGGGSVSIAGVSDLGIFAKRQLFYGESWWQIAALPLRIFFSGQDDKPQYFDGVLSPMLILFLPWAFKGKWLEEKRIFFGFALLYFLYSFFLVDLRIRYILPIVPPLAILLVFGIHNIFLRIVHPSLLVGVVILLLASNGIYLWDYFHSVSPTEYLRGKESRDVYLSRMLFEYPVIQHINQNLPPTAKIYFLFMGRRVYYCERDYFHDAGELPGFFLQVIQSARDENEVKVKFRQRGITHLLVRLDLFFRFLNDNLTPPQQELWNRFQNRYLTLLFEQRGYGLYGIRNEA